MLHPAHPQVLIGGGQDAADVTTTADRAGGFQSRFFHKVSSCIISAHPLQAGTLETMLLLSLHPHLPPMFLLLEHWIKVCMLVHLSRLYDLLRWAADLHGGDRQR